jgi:IclR family transcriptional regulator, acetate operon repressor
MKLETRSVKSADRAIDILEFVADATVPPSFTALMAGTQIPRSSLFHLLNNLQGRGYLSQDQAGGYRLGERLRQLAARLDTPSPAALVIPHLRRLSGAVNETAGFYVRREDMAEIVATIIGGQALNFTMRVGELAPLYAVSAGKIMLAQLAEKELDDYLARVGFEQITPQTLRSGDALRREIAIARREGFAYSREEFTPGITGIAIAVVHGTTLLGALNLAVPTSRFTVEQAAMYRKELRSVAGPLAQALRP